MTFDYSPLELGRAHVHREMSDKIAVGVTPSFKDTTVARDDGTVSQIALYIVPPEREEIRGGQIIFDNEVNRGFHSLHGVRVGPYNEGAGNMESI